MSYCRPSCPDAHKPVLHSGHDDFEDAKQALANMVAIIGDRHGGWRCEWPRCGRKNASCCPCG